jgi:p-aminobenzoyl-glutamate transporter AbgT
MDSLLKNTLKRQMPYLIGGTITGTIIAYYYGFLFSIIVNSIIWFVISTIVNKYYWNYTGFKDEKRLISKYLIHRKDSNAQANNVNGYSRMRKEDDGMTTTNNIHTSISKKLGESNQENIGSPIK